MDDQEIEDNRIKRTGSSLLSKKNPLHEGILKAIF